jgi:hypothetical protein
MTTSISVSAVLLTMMAVIRVCGCDSSAEPTASPTMMRAAA